MTESGQSERWRPGRVQVVAVLLVLAGFALCSVSWWWLLLTAAGTFGPGLCRELGFLQDRDEFQRQADHRAGYHAFLTSGLAAFLLVAYFRSGDRRVEDAQEAATLLLALMWCSWVLSALLAYWGPVRSAARLLYGFGAAWLLFTIVSNTGSEWTGWTALLLHPLLAAPFFVLGWLSGRAPRATGGLLVIAAVFFFRFFGMFRGESVSLMNDGITFLLFVGPLLATGVALLSAQREEPDADPDEELD